MTAHDQATNTGSIKVLFLGQCLQYGYGNVGKASTYVSLTASMLRARFPGLKFKFDLKYLYHPAGLKALLKHRMFFYPPDIALLNLPAMFAATTWRVNLVYEMAPEIVDTARSFMQKIEAKMKGNTGPPEMTTMIDKAFALRRPLSVAEYERLVQEALEECVGATPCRFVLLGPGRFNEETIEDYAVHSPEVWSSVNQMVQRLGNRFNVPAVSAQEALAEYGGEVFTPNNHRWSEYGHEIVAREVESVLALQVAHLSRSGS
ncbi:MAG: hypothetical protein WAV47_15495 [Blastocatellia bacterium]